MQSKHRGAHSELVACVWLLSQGYEVYRNISQHGLGDLIAVKSGQMLRIDVKTSSQGYRIPLKPWQTAQNVAALYVFSDGHCELELRPEQNILLKIDCPHCSRAFMQRRSFQKFCSRPCHDQFRNLQRRERSLDAR